MARGVNKVIIVGNLGADPDAKSMPSGNMVANFSVATTESWNDRDTGERQEKTEWHRVVFFGRIAEIADQYLKAMEPDVCECKNTMSVLSVVKSEWTYNMQ